MDKTNKEDLIEALSQMTVQQAVELRQALERRWNVRPIVQIVPTVDFYDGRTSNPPRPDRYDEYAVVLSTPAPTSSRPSSSFAS